MPRSGSHARCAMMLICHAEKNVKNYLAFMPVLCKIFGPVILQAFMAQRIRSRAIRRAGELLKQIEPAKPAPNQHAAGVGAHTSRTEAAKTAGLSKHQQVQAVRVASIPSDVFDVCAD